MVSILARVVECFSSLLRGELFWGHTASYCLIQRVVHPRLQVTEARSRPLTSVQCLDQKYLEFRITSRSYTVKFPDRLSLLSRF
jgi:hypothetical protein